MCRPWRPFHSLSLAHSCTQGYPLLPSHPRPGLPTWFFFNVSHSLPNFLYHLTRENRDFFVAVSNLAFILFLTAQCLCQDDSLRGEGVGRGELRCLRTRTDSRSPPRGEWYWLETQDGRPLSAWQEWADFLKSSYVTFPLATALFPFLFLHFCLPVLGTLVTHYLSLPSDGSANPLDEEFQQEK